MRIDQIRLALRELPGSSFESFARILLRMKLYPGINTTSPSYDMGEDARTEISTLQLNDGKYYSVFASKTSTITKLRRDCQRAKDTNRTIDIVVFAIGGNPREDTIDNWKARIKNEFGWDLVVHPLEYIVEIACEPEFESLVYDFLGVPPFGGDFLTQIEETFARETNRALANISTSIPGIENPIEREEVKRIEDQLDLGKFVLLVGEAGSGKSGIAYQLTENSTTPVIFLDARRLGEIRSATDLRNHFDLNGSVENAIIHLARTKGGRVIIDQLDNSIGLPVSDLLIDLVIDIKDQDDVEVIVISRKREAHEKQFLEKLSPDKGFVELNSNPLSEELVKNLLHDIGISSTSKTIIEMGKNLLNLEIIGRIVQENPSVDFTKLNSEIDLWEKYISVIKDREGRQGDTIIEEAIRLATIGLRAEDRSFTLDTSRTPEQQRLESWRIIVCDYGRVYRFHHEKLQDYLYAFDATERGLTKDDVINELGDTHRTRNIYLMMRDIYERNAPSRLPQYLREAWNV